MAQVDSFNNPNDPTNPNNPNAAAQTGPQGSNQPATSGGGGAVTATGSGNVTGQVSGTANPAQPFQNISSYLAANAPQSQQLAQQVAGTVSAPINEASQGITSAADKFTQSVNAGYTPENKDLISAVSQNPAYVVAENPDNVANFKANLNDKYTGPSDFTTAQGYSDLQAKIAAAQAQAENTKSQAGVQTLLKGVEGPTTEGINKLDSLLLNLNPENLKSIQDAGAGAAKLLPTLNQTATDRNAFASQASTNASDAAAHALQALTTARGSTSKNLSDEQKTIEGIVKSYNDSIGVINPVTQSIAQSIKDFLTANPQLSISNATDALAPLMNLQSINMPGASTYASPNDYKAIQALATLGDTNLSGLPIDVSTADQAQTFKLPTQLMDALGKAPGVEQALNDELNALGGQITSAVAPFQDVQNQRQAIWSFYDQYGPNVQKAQQAIQAANVDYVTTYQAHAKNPNVPEVQQAQAKLDAAKKALSDLQIKKNQLDQQGEALGGQAANLAQGLQWVNTAAPGYNDLIAAINEQLGKLGSVGVPSLTYSPGTVTDPVTGAPIGANVGKDIGNAAGLATAVGVPAAAGISSGIAAGAVPLTASALAAAGPGAVAGEVPAAGAGLSSGVSAAGSVALPAALAAYGTANVVQNSLKNPITSGISTLANTGLSLATLSLPPQIFQSIGKEISSVLNSIGNFFGGLF